MCVCVRASVRERVCTDVFARVGGIELDGGAVDGGEEMPAMAERHLATRLDGKPVAPIKHVPTHMCVGPGRDRTCMR